MALDGNVHQKIKSCLKHVDFNSWLIYVRENHLLNGCAEFSHPKFRFITI